MTPGAAAVRPRPAAGRRSEDGEDSAAEDVCMRLLAVYMPDFSVLMDSEKQCC